MGIVATDISQRVVEAVLAQKLAPGARLGERQLAVLFDRSRIIVRAAFGARRFIERLNQHVQQEQAALQGDDVGPRSFLPGDFHVCPVRTMSPSWRRWAPATAPAARR